MGAWGFEPFQNDQVLDELYKCRNVEDVKKFIYSGIGKVKGRYINIYEVSALLLESFGLYEGLVERKNIERILKDVEDNNFTYETFKSMGGASVTMLCTIAIPVVERKEMLLRAITTLGIFIKDTYKFINFNGSIITTELPEESLPGNLIKIYNLGKKTLNSNFADADLTSIGYMNINWLLRKYEEQRGINFVESWNHDYPKGITVLKDVELSFNNATGNVMYRYFTTKSLFMHAAELGVTFEILKLLQPRDAKEWLDEHYPKGFRSVKIKGTKLYKLISLDTGKALETDKEEFGGEYTTAAFTLDKIKKLKKYAKVTAGKSEPELVYLVSRRKKNKVITGYEVRRFGNTLDVLSRDELRSEVEKGNIVVHGMKFTKDGKLVKIGRK